MPEFTPVLRSLAIAHTGGATGARRPDGRRRSLAVVCSDHDLPVVRAVLRDERSLEVVLTVAPGEDVSPAEREDTHGDPLLGRIRTRVASSGADLVWCHANGAGPALMERVEHALDGLGIEVVGDRAFFDSVLRRYPLRLLDAAALVPGAGAWGVRPDASAHLPRWIDVLGALFGIAVALPVLLVLALAVRLTSPGPVLYRQVRVGLNGRPFEMLKFRSMHEWAEKDGPVWAEDGDRRVTPIGAFLRRTHLDELPQLFNILAGQMSFIGPRPERPEFEQDLIQQIPHYSLRHLVKPGITGWAQVNRPYGASVEAAWAKVELDLYYIRNRSWRLDLVILWRTLRISLFGSASR